MRVALRGAPEGRTNERAAIKRCLQLEALKVLLKLCLRQLAPYSFYVDDETVANNVDQLI